MGVYVDNVLVAVQQGAAFNGNITLKAGPRHTVVEEWDRCGGATFTTINLTAAAVGPQVSMSANPSAIVKGGSASLAIQASNANQVSVVGSDGSSYWVSASGGTLTVKPTQSVTYTATATGVGTSASSSATLTVRPAPRTVSPPPTVSLSPGQSPILAGKSTVLVISATNASQVTVMGSDGTSYVVAGAGGSVPVAPQQTTTYTAVANGAGGTASSSTIVTVTPAPPTVAVSASLATIQAGGSSVLTVAASGSTLVKVAGSDGSMYALGATGGSVPVNPTQTTTYVASAIGVGGTTSSSVTVTVKAAPPTISMNPSPASIVAGKSSQLTIVATGSTAVTVTGSDGSTYSLAAAGGVLTVSPKETTSYIASATGAGGSASANAELTVVPPPMTVTLAANPSTISAGKSSVLTVAATSATQVTLTGSDGSTYNVAASGGTVTVNPTQTTTYTVVATGADGEASANAVVTFNAHAIPANAISSGNLEGAANWQWNHDPGTPGTSVGSTQYPVASPSTDGSAREHSYSYYGHGGEIYHVSFARDAAATNFVYDTYVYVTDPSQTRNVEMDMNQVIANGNTVIFGTQCAGGSGTWEYTVAKGTGTQWLPSNIPCDPTAWTANTWHHVQIATHRDVNGTVTYDWVNFDGTYSDFQNASGPSAFSLNWAPGVLLVNFQLDGASAGNGSAVIYTDQMQVYRW